MVDSLRPLDSTSVLDDSVRVALTLSSRATAELGVRRLTVIRKGRSFWTGTVRRGQTAVRLPLPVAPATLVAASRSAVVDRLDVRVAGRSVP